MPALVVRFSMEAAVEHGYPRKPASWYSVPLWLDEEGSCSSLEENDRWLFGELMCVSEWDRRHAD